MWVCGEDKWEGGGVIGVEGSEVTGRMGWWPESGNVHVRVRNRFTIRARFRARAGVKGQKGWC